MTLRRAAAEGGFMLALAAAIAAGLLVVAAARSNTPGARDLTGTKTEVKVVPAIGEQGYDVETFCNDQLTTAAKDLVTPPDSTYSATYHLERTKGGVHELVTVGLYADPNRQPTAAHYDSANIPTDAFVSKAAVACMVKKAGK